MHRINGNLIYIDVLLQNTCRTFALVDEGCQCYAAINKDLAIGLGLTYVTDECRSITGASKSIRYAKSKGVVAFFIEINGFRENTYAYVIPDLSFLLILGNP